jgi:hypothetical protein
LTDNVAVTAGSGTNMATDERTIAAVTVHVQRVYEIGATAGAVGQITVTNTSTQVVAARDTRKNITIVNRQTVPIYVDHASSATTGDFRLDPGDSLTLHSTSAVNAITAAPYSAVGDAKVHFTEQYD